MRRTIHLHGYLKDLIPGPIVLDTETVAEAITGLCQVTGKALQPNLETGRHRLKVVGFDTVDSLYMPTDETELHIVPSFSGGKQGGVFQVILGIVLIAAALATGNPLLAGAGLSLTGTVALFGATMLLGGLLEMVSPAPKIDTGAGDPEASKYLQANKNTVKIGTRIPLLFGRFPVYGQFISFNIDAKDVVDPGPYVAPTTTVLDGVDYLTLSMPL